MSSRNRLKKVIGHTPLRREEANSKSLGYIFLAMINFIIKQFLDQRKECAETFAKQMISCLKIWSQYTMLRTGSGWTGKYNCQCLTREMSVMKRQTMQTRSFQWMGLWSLIKKRWGPVFCHSVYIITLFSISWCNRYLKKSSPLFWFKKYIWLNSPAEWLNIYFVLMGWRTFYNSFIASPPPLRSCNYFQLDNSLFSWFQVV